MISQEGSSLLKSCARRSFSFTCGISQVFASGGYSNSGAPGKDFQKLMFSKKEKEL